MLNKAVTYLFDIKYWILFHKLILWNIITIKKYIFLFEFTLKYNLFLWSEAEFSASLLQS